MTDRAAESFGDDLITLLHLRHQRPDGHINQPVLALRVEAGDVEDPDVADEVAEQPVVAEGDQQDVTGVQHPPDFGGRDTREESDVYQSALVALTPQIGFKGTATDQ